ncbi:hypothetical protein O1L68_01565 [Streptomyces lydicus]|nr:hypothetical protein [Streptomyces lydicus]
MPAVAGAAVVAVADARGHARLAAYLVPAAGSGAPAASELRTALGRTLPPHMMPAAFVVLDALPLTTSGKLDRRALPAPTSTRPRASGVRGPAPPPSGNSPGSGPPCSASRRWASPTTSSNSAATRSSASRPSPGPAPPDCA